MYVDYSLIYDHLRKNYTPLLKYLEFVESAKVPIIKVHSFISFHFFFSFPSSQLIHKETNVPIDISFNNLTGIYGGELIKGWMKDHLCFTPLVLLMKTFLFLRNLNETYTGGLGSFSTSVLGLYLPYVPIACYLR